MGRKMLRTKIVERKVLVWNASTHFAVKHMVLSSWVNEEVSIESEIIQEQTKNAVTNTAQHVRMIQWK